MKEKELIKTIQSVINSDYIGDDCAYLKDLGITVSQDNLVENVHFKTEFATPYQLGYKSVMVNVSDICASGAEPAFLTISLSLPSNTPKNFVKEFYEGAKSACGKNIKIIGGDLTSSDKIYISACAIGRTANRNISSRKNAKIGYKIIVSGEHGSSSAGLSLLLNNKTSPQEFIKSHLMPDAQIEFSNQISKIIKEDYAMMDTSDGLADALSQIAEQSCVLFEIDFDKIPHNKKLEQFSNWQDLILYGGEDYQLVAVIPEKYDIGTQIGIVKKGCGIDLKTKNGIHHLTKNDVEKKIFNHFGGQA